MSACESIGICTYAARMSHASDPTLTGVLLPSGGPARGCQTPAAV